MIFGTRDAIALAAEGMDADLLAAPIWRDELKADSESRMQAFARRLMAAGHHGLMVRSFAPGAGPDDLNLVLWSWGDGAPARLVLIDDEGRLSQ